MSKLLVDERSLEQAKLFINSPNQSLLLIGDKYSDKNKLCLHICSELLHKSVEDLDSYPYMIRIGEDMPKSIGIEDIRKITKFLNLKVPIVSEINRIIVIFNADLLTTQSQNAILKSIEEPPVGTLFILCCESSVNLLPTIISRSQSIKVGLIDQVELKKHFIDQGFNKKDIDQAINLSGGLPILANKIISDDENELNESLNLAKKLLTSDLTNRLIIANNIYKDKKVVKDLLFIIKQIAKANIKSDDKKLTEKWLKILNATIDAEDKINKNTLVRLVLTNYLLTIS